MALRARTAVVLAKIESQTGVDATPVQATDAILVESPQVDPEVNLIETDEVTGSLDRDGPVTGGIRAKVSFACLLKGAGAAGTAPEFGKLLKACGFAETITATAIPAAPEACAAGGSTTTAVLGTTAAATAQLYRGMPIVLSGNQSGTSFISDYTAAKLATLTDLFAGAIVATTSYQIPANVLYSPASASIPSLTLYVYMDGVLYKLVGCRGSFRLALEAGGIGRLSFDFQGLYVSKTDAAVPSAPVYDSTRPPVWRAGKMLIDRVASGVAQLGLDAGITTAMPGNPNASEGFDAPIHTGRRLTGSMNPLEELVATRDIMGDFRAGTRKIVHARLGTAAGNRIGLTWPQAQYTGQRPGARDGLAAVDVPFAGVGRDAGAFLCFY